MTDTTETEWVEGDWDAVTVGDLVRLKAAVGTIQGPVESIDGVAMFVRGAASACFLRDRWTLYVEAPPKVELPTEPFTTILAEYLPAGNANTKTTHLTLLPASEGNQKVEWSYSNGLRVQPDDLPRIRSFTVIAAPVPETAKKVLERVFESLPAGSAFPNEVSNLAREFGIQS